ncbi:MAG TPA: PilZ domain-containing protein [Terriglobia bacterium]|nr:PilZ domain-containing protein [Terriglobia bacterium]
MAQSKRRKERRKSSRISLAVPVFARGSDERGKEFLEFTTALNISASGALIAMRRYLPPQTSIVVEIPAAPMPRLATQPTATRTLEAELVRVTPSQPSFLWALRFNHPLS